MRHGGRSILGAATAAFVLLAGLGVVAAGPASAVNPTITVTTTADVINGSDGVLSLREAVIEADTDAGADTIQLAPSATYGLTICGPSEPSIESPDATVGDLDATDAAGLTILGSGATIHQSCTQRVLQSAPGSGTLTLDHLALTGGQSTTGAAILAWGPLTLDHADVSGATVDPVDAHLGEAAVVTQDDTTISDSAVHDNDAMGLSCAGVQLPEGVVTSGSCMLVRSSIRDNTATGAFAAGIAAPWGLSLTDSEVVDNLNTTSSGVGGIVVTHDVSIVRSTISRNEGQVGGVFGYANLVDSVVSANTGRTGPGGVLGHVDMLRSTLADNVGKTAGGLASESDDANTVTSSTVSGNRAEDPASGVAGVGGAVVLNDTSSLTLTNSTMTGNRGGVAGGIVAQGQSPVATQPGNHITLVSSTVVGDVNTSPTPGPASEIAFYNRDNFTGGTYGTLELQGSALGGTQPTGGRVCSTSGGQWTVVTHGYNVVADSTCPFPFLMGPGDVAGLGDPGLSTLGDHGGTTETMAPTIGSPLLDRLPVGPLCPTVDQRGVDRPVGSGCDSGAVESNSPVFPDGDPYTPVAPVRLLDSRNPPIGTIWAFAPIVLPIAGTHGVPGDATAVVVNVTGTDVVRPTFFTVYPSSSGPPPNASNVNLAPGQTAANLVTVKLGGDGAIALANADGLPNVIVDLMGFYAPAPEGTSTFRSITPERLADSREQTTLQTFTPHGVQSMRVAGGATPVPADAAAVVVNVTATDVTASTGTFLTVYPKGGSTPNVSNLNLAFHETRANLAIVKVGADHAISIFNDSGTANVIVDVVGYFTADVDHAEFVGLSPTRLIDTRSTGHIGTMHPFGPDESQAFTVTGGSVPADATAVVINVTVTDSVTGTFVTAYPTPVPADLDPPEASSVNVGPFQTNPNLVIVKVGADGKVSIYNRLGTANVVVDLVGYYR